MSQSNDDDPTVRGKSLANTVGPRLLAYGDRQSPLANGDSYVPLLVRESEARVTSRFLAIAPEVASDVARLLDAVLLQGQLIADLRAELAATRAEVDQLRKAATVTEVAARMQNDLLITSKAGLEVKKYKCLIDTKTHFSKMSNVTATSTGDISSGTQRSILGNSEFGNLFDVLKGAKLHGQRATESLSRLELASRFHTTTDVSRVEEATAVIEAEHLIPRFKPEPEP